MERRLWQNDLGLHHCPPWPCPVCKKGTIRLRAGSLNREETIDSKKEQDQDYWGPEFIEFVFTAWADCSNEGCKQSFSISGTGGVGQYFDDDRDSVDWYEYFTPKLVAPAPHIFFIPRTCPQTVKQKLKEAFSLYWSDSEACAGRLRSSTEALLSHIGIPDMDGEPPAKQARITLHKRIEIFSRDHPQLGRLLMAMKWLGNSGSHGKPVGKDDLLDAFELLEHALTELLDKRSARLNELAEKLTIKHQPK